MSRTESALIIMLASVAAALLACGAPASAPVPAGTASPGSESPVVPRGERLLGIDVNQAPGEDFDAALQVAREAGLQFTSLSMAWDELEPRPGEYAPDPNWLTIANSYYAERDVPLVLTITPIDTNRIRLPADLMGREFDDPQVMDRFERLLEFVFTQMPDVELIALAIGNEVDATLGSDGAAWAQYLTFFEAAAAQARSIRPEVPVGVKVTMSGLTGESRDLARALNASADIVLATYYPLEPDFGVRDPAVVGGDFSDLSALYPSRPIAFLEVGYPSSEILGSSVERQAEFVRQVFRAWDERARQVVMLNLTWLTDAPDESVQSWTEYYGLSDDRFAAYLATLGLRRADGAPKPALEALTAEARARGW